MFGRLAKCGKDLPGTEMSAPNALTSILLPVFDFQKPVYSSFLAWSRAVFGERFYVAPYDWRKGADDESANNLDAVIDEAIAQTGHRKVILLAHSLGGLVSRDYILRKGSAKVAALIAVGTPWLGTPKTVRALLWGYNFGAGMILQKKYQVQVNGLPSNHSPLCPDSKCEYYQSISLLRLHDVRELASRFPAVYQQLPTNKFMNYYGSHYEQDFRPVVWGKNSPEQMEALYKQTDACLFDKTKAWQQWILNGDDRGVNNYLVAGVYEPRCTNPEFHKDCHVENRMDMQMPEEAQLDELTLPSFSRGGLGLAKRLLRALSPYEIFQDPFLAIDSDYEWGDGTAPILSATAGEYVKGIKKTNSQEAKKHLGNKTEVLEPVVLGASYPHFVMLDDPQVRKLIVDLYQKESLKLGATSIFEESVAVESLKVKITADREPDVQVEAEFTGGRYISRLNLRKSAYFVPELFIAFDDKLSVDDLCLKVPKEKATSRPMAVKRRLLSGEIPAMMLTLRSIRKNSPSLKVTSVEVWINDVRQFESNEPFELMPGGKKSIPLSGDRIERSLLIQAAMLPSH
jgi:pimeloyl-ACP methyl ester carboxylesterase